MLLLLFLPLGRRRRLGVRLSLARSASLSLVFLTASFPVVVFSGCGGDPVVRLYHVDRLGSTQVVTDWNGAIYRQMRYFAYGEIRGRFDAAGANANFAEDARWEFTGYETDFAGLDYAGARFFDPELGQFGSHDPAGEFPSPYAYGPGDPVNFVDPTGAFVEAVVFAALAQIASAIDTYNQTGSCSKASVAGLETAANQVTGGMYGAVKANRNGEIGAYLEDYALNQATGGIYGTVQAFNNGQIASGIVAVVGLAYGVYARIESQLPSSATVSGTDLVGIENDTGLPGLSIAVERPPPTIAGDPVAIWLNPWVAIPILLGATLTWIAARPMIMQQSGGKSAAELAKRLRELEAERQRINGLKDQMGRSNKGDKGPRRDLKERLKEARDRFKGHAKALRQKFGKNVGPTP